MTPQDRPATTRTTPSADPNDEDRGTAPTVWQRQSELLSKRLHLLVTFW